MQTRASLKKFKDSSVNTPIASSSSVTQSTDVTSPSVQPKEAPVSNFASIISNPAVPPTATTTTYPANTLSNDPSTNTLQPSVS